MNVKDRLITYIESKEIKKSHFEKNIGVSNGYINSLKDSPSAEKLELISKKYLDLNISWLLTGEGTMLNDDGEKVSILKPNKDAPELTGYYYPNVSASAGLDISTLNQELEKVPIYLPNFGKDIDFINVYGDSMYPKYNAGEIIGIKLIECEKR